MSTIDVTTRGVIPDNITDNSPAMNALIASLPASGGVLMFPSGNYRFGSTVAINKSSISIKGEGAYASTVLWYDGTANFMDVRSAAFTSFSDMTLRSLTAGWNGNLIAVRNTGSDPAGTNLHRMNLSPPPAAVGLCLDTSIMTTVEDTWFMGGAVGLLGRLLPSSYANVVNVRGGQFQRQTSGAVYIGGEAWSFTGVNFEARADGQGVAFVGDPNMPVAGLSFTGCWFGDATAQQRWVSAFGTNISFAGNNITV